MNQVSSLPFAGGGELAVECAGERDKRACLPIGVSFAEYRVGPGL